MPIKCKKIKKVINYYANYFHDLLFINNIENACKNVKIAFVQIAYIF